MKEGDKIIWDSYFGYEIGYYVSDKGVMYNTVLVNLITGIIPGNVSLSKKEIYPYTEKKQQILEKKYGYERKFD